MIDELAPISALATSHRVHALLVPSSRRLILAAVVFLAVEGCGLVPEKVSLTDPQIKPLLEAMDQVDRTALGFTPVTTNAQISLELHSGGPYDAMLHIYGATSRTIAFRKSQSGYRWISEQEIYEGPKWHHTVDGTFRESIVIEYQTEPVNGIPIKELSIRYTGSDPNLTRRKFTLAEVRPILEEWSTLPLEPKPPDFPGESFPDPLPAMMVLLALLALLAGCCLVLIVGVAGLAVAVIMLATGIVSSSILVGILRRSVSSGFRTLFLQLGALAGAIGGGIATCGITWITRARWNTPQRWILGVGLGLVVGILFAWLFNKMWGWIARELTHKLEVG